MGKATTEDGNVVLVCKECIENVYPNKGKIDAGVGELVKVRFKIENQFGDDIGNEYMWVKVTRSDIEKGEYEGILENDPIYVTGIKYGDIVNFKKEDIFDKEIISFRKIRK